MCQINLKRRKADCCCVGGAGMTSTALYRSLMEVIERRRLELGLSMERVNDLAGAADRYYGKMIYPDTPSGRQARWETVDEFMQALFGCDYEIQIVPGALNRLALTALSEPVAASRPSINIRHWRHSRHFKELGKKGGLARAAKLSPAQRTAIAKRANRAMRRKRKGEAHKAKNEAARDA